MGKWCKGEKERGNKMKKLERRQRQIEYALLAAVFFILCFFLYRYTVYTLDSDAASELVLAKTLHEEGKLLTKSWYYGSELRVFYSQLLFAPLFSLTGDWSMVRMVGTLLMLLALLGSFSLFCRAANCKAAFPLAAALMLLPLSRIYLDVLYKFSYYLPHAIMGFLIPALLVFYGKRQDRGRWAYGLPALAMLLSFAVGLNGLRLLLTVQVPLALAAALLFRLGERDQQGKRLLAGSGLALAAALAGCGINAGLLARKYAVLDVAGIHFKRFSLSGVEQVLGGLMEALGYRTEAGIFSPALLYCTLGGLLLVLSFYASFYILRRRQAYQRGAQFAAAYNLAALALLCLLYCFTDMSFTGRYLVQSAVLSLPPVIICFQNKARFGKAGQTLLLGLMCFALVCSALHYNEMRKEDKTRGQRECAAFLAEQGYTQGYASFWNGNVLSELSDGALELWVWDEQLNRVEQPGDINRFLQLRAHENPPEGRLFVLLSANENYYCWFTKNFSQENIVFKTSNYSPQAIDEYLIYGFDSYDALAAQFGS